MWVQDFQTVAERDPEADQTVVLSFTGSETWTACWEERPQVCDEIRLALAEVRRGTTLAGLRGTPGGCCSGPSCMGPR